MNQPAKKTGTHVNISRKNTRSAPEPEDAYHVGHFGPQSGLTPKQAWQAERLLRRKQAERSLRGYALVCRKGGIVSAILGERVGNSKWARSMLAKLGGQTLARHNHSHLRRISSLGVDARQAIRLRG